jgi:hypothetical protein
VKEIVCVSTSLSKYPTDKNGNINVNYTDGISYKHDGQVTQGSNGKPSTSGTGTSSGSGGGGCFEAGTQVTMADGSFRNIEDIKKGDIVKSYNIYTKELGISVVEQTYELTQPDDLVILTFADGTTL